METHADADSITLGEHTAKVLSCRDGRGPKTGDRDHGCDPGKPAHGDGRDLFGTPQGSPRTDKLLYLGGTRITEQRPAGQF